jgi:XTP/dITP diphosphohydrolase
MARLLIATENPGKLIEMRALLQDLPAELVTPADLGLALRVAETGHTYAENAALKARAYLQASGLTALADDSGLEVAALDGAPGLHSARFTGIPGATDADRRARLLDLLRDKPRPWPAAFRCTVAIAVPGGQVYYREGACPGEIIPEERGDDGFGYDPIFYIPEAGATMAELGRAVKNTISHRARAVHAAIPLLAALLAGTPA